MKYIVPILWSAALTFGFSVGIHASEEWQCEIEDYEGPKPRLESSGVNPRCPENDAPWSCYCRVVEVCEEKNSGMIRTTRRLEFMFCGTLGECIDATWSTYCH